MKKPLSIVACLAAALMSLHAADFTPLSVTGYNFDAVVENNSTNFGNSSQSLDATGNTFYESGLSAN